MKRIIHQPFLIGLLMAITACNDKRNPQANCDKVASDNVISLRIDKSYYVDKFSNLFSDVQYIALEETPNSIIGSVSKLEITNDGDLIVFDVRAGSVLRFASDGRFLNNIGVRGAGRNEYILPEDMKYDPFNNNVLVWDNGKSSILVYGLDGVMESKIQLPWIIASFGIIDNNHIICYMNNGDVIRGDDKGTNYKIVNYDGIIEHEFGDFGKEKIGFYPPSGNTFRFQLGRCLCLPPYSYTLYSIEGTAFEAIATFDLHDNSIPQDWLTGQFQDFYQNLGNNPELIEIVSAFETKDYYFLNLSKNKLSILCMVQKDNGKVKSLAVDFINDIYGMEESSVLKCAYKEKLFFAIDPTDFESRTSWLRFIPNNATAAETKQIFTQLQTATLSACTEFYGDEGIATYIDSLKTSDIKLVSGEREFINEMSKRSNPIIQVCMLK